MVSGASVALGIVAIVVAATIAFALRSTGRLKMSPQEYIVGGRSFGALFLWLLLAGEVYTSFTFLGAAGWAYGRGAPAYYIMSYGACAFVLGYFLLPKIWQVAKERGLLTGPDFFADRYRSRALGILVAFVQLVFIIPYITLQISGLQILLTIAGYGSFSATAGAGVAFVVIALFVFTAGLRGAAWASVVKDALVLGAIVFVGIAVPTHFFGSVPNMLAHLRAAHASMLTLGAATSKNGGVWYVSTVLLSALGFYMFPGSFTSIYSAKSGDVLRRNAVFLPVYHVIMILALLAGFTALLVAPGLRGAHADESFMLVVQRYYPPWVLGLVAAAGSLAALVPASVLLLSTASVVAKNVLSDGFGLANGDAQRVLATRIFVLVIALLALFLWLFERETLVGLLLLVYDGITQLLPGVLCAFAWRRATAWGVAAGIAAGVATAAALTAGTSPLGLNPGFVALGVNALVLVGVSIATQSSRDSRPAYLPAD
ncbi:MAG: sodium:solute symporter family protein [Candidatus Tyrphobacter sp.]